MKITLKQLHGWAVRCGYKGSETDPDAIKKHFADNQIGNLSLPDGTALDLSTVEIEPEKATLKTFKIEADKADVKIEQPFDADVAVKAALETRLKALGLDEATLKARPRIVTDDDSDRDATIKTRSTAEQAWDAYRESTNGNTFFKGKNAFQRVMLFRDLIVGDLLAPNQKLLKSSDWGSDLAEFTPKLQARLKGGFHGKAYATFPNAAGGALTATEFRADLIQNVNQFGASGALTKTLPMSEKRMELPVATGIPQVLWPEEGSANTDSTAEAFSNVQLDAKTGVVTAKLSRQVIQDSYIGLMDFFAMEFARGFAYMRDLIFFNGDGTSYYGHMSGLKTAFEALGTLSTVATNGGGVVTGASDAITYTASHFAQCIARCPAYALPNARWTVSPAIWAANMLRLGLANGGSPGMEMVDGLPRYKFMGFPVVFNNIVNTGATDAGANKIDAYFGDFSRGVVTGDRMTFEFDTNDSIYFTSNAVAIRGIERYHTVVHDVGTGTAPGPIVALIES